MRSHFADQLARDLRQVPRSQAGRLADEIVRAEPSRADAQRMHDVYGRFGISVFALRGATIDELAGTSP
jgi:hypothetical protein